MIFTMVQVGIVAASAYQSGDYTYDLSGNNATITDYTGTDVNLTIPDTIDSHPVSGIASYAFQDCTELETVVIPSSVTTIGESPFWGCTQLTQINVVVANSYFSSQDGVLFNKASSTLIMCPLGKSGEGNAPTTMSSNVFSNCASGFTVYYHSTSTGFSNPWYGYPAATY